MFWYVLALFRRDPRWGLRAAASLLAQVPGYLYHRLGRAMYGDEYDSGCWMCGGTGKQVYLEVRRRDDLAGRWMGFSEQAFRVLREETPNWMGLYEVGKRTEEKCPLCNGFHL